MFQTTYLEKKACFSYIESYFITACQNNKILTLCRSLIYHWLEKHNDIMEYLFVYNIFDLAIEAYPDEWNRVIHYPRTSTLVLVEEMYKPYNEKIFSEIINRYPFHKLTHRWPGEPGSGYEYLINHCKKFSPTEQRVPVAKD